MIPSEGDMDRMGIKRHKPAPSLYKVNPELYAEPIAWIRRQLMASGYDVVRAVLDPYMSRWSFYDVDGDFVIAVEHALVERVLGCQLWKEYTRLS